MDVAGFVGGTNDAGGNLSHSWAPTVMGGSVGGAQTNNFSAAHIAPKLGAEERDKNFVGGRINRAIGECMID